MDTKNNSLQEEQVMVRMTSEQRMQIQSAADSAGLPISSFIRSEMLKIATESQEVRSK